MDGNSVFLLAWASLFSIQSFKLWQAIGLFFLSLFLFLSNAKLSMIFIYIVIVGVLFLQSRFTRKEKLLVMGTATVFVGGMIAYFVFSYMKGNIASYQLNRLLGFINPNEYASSSGYQYVIVQNVMKIQGYSVRKI